MATEVRTTTRNTKARGWCVTINNYTEEDITHLRLIDCTYGIWGREVAPTTGTPHLQCFFYWTNARSFNMVKTLFRDWHLEQAKGNSYQNFVYCSKEGEFEEKGVRPKDPKEGGKKAQDQRWDDAFAAASAGNMDEIPADLRVRYYHTWDRIRESTLRNNARDETDAQMLWYWGEAGTGKSRKARDENPGCYLKMCSKWWCNYMGEKVVLIEDFDRDHSKLVHHLKIWADRYPFPAEVKGGSITIRPELIIVTSNYHPRDIWDRDADLQPILRRFKCVEFKKLGAAAGAAGVAEAEETHLADCETFVRPSKKPAVDSGDY